jgi:isocitrate dehydrogenase
VRYPAAQEPFHGTVSRPTPSTKALVGVDVFLDWDDAERSAEILGQQVGWLAGDGLSLAMITNRGVKVFPGGAPETFCTDHWRARFLATPPKGAVTHADVHALLGRFLQAGLDVIKTENLYTFDGKPGYSLGQGQ